MAPGPTGGDTTGIVVNFRTKDLTLDAARSLLAQAEIVEVIIVDNDSRDDSVPYLQARLAGAPVRVVSAPENLGFGRAANLGAREATTPLLALLNSDARLEPRALTPLREALERDTTVGIVAPFVHLPGGTLQHDAHGVFPSLTTMLLRTNRRPPDSLTPDWVSGVALVVRRDEFLHLGGFDERIHMYFEDVLLCRRYREAGYRVVREPRARAVHAGGRSWSSTPEKNAAYDRGQLHYFTLAGASRFTLLILRAALWAGRRLRARAG